MSWFSDLEQRVNTSIFQYRSPNVGLANSGHTMQSRYMVAEGGLTIASLALGGMGAARVASTTKPARVVMSWIRHPIAHILARGNIAFVSRGASAYLLTSKVYRRITFAAFIANPMATLYYLKSGQYDKAAISHFGPPGSVWLYNRLKPEGGSRDPNDYSDMIIQTRGVGSLMPPIKTSSKKSPRPCRCKDGSYSVKCC